MLNRNGIRTLLRSPFGPQGRQFVEVVELAKTDRWEVDGQMERLDLLGQELAAPDREIRERAKVSPVAQALEQIPGIGPSIASLPITEVGDVRRLPTPKHLVSYIRLAAALYDPGEHRWTGPTTKHGSTLPRWALVQAAHRAQLSPRFYGFYQRQRDRHGTSRAAVAPTL